MFGRGGDITGCKDMKHVKKRNVTSNVCPTWIPRNIPSFVNIFEIKYTDRIYSVKVKGV